MTLVNVLACCMYKVAGQIVTGFIILFKINMSSCSL